MCVPIGFWRQGSMQPGVSSPDRRPIMERETSVLPVHRHTLVFKVIINMTTASEPQILACAVEIELAQD